ncbi:hypothetical protein FPV67DRAFT_1483674 [Lyophyllum atratum]|nr:hypothetical protein FPV67DRAFT_1483674 [Lyophyllum atratum]
MRAHRMPIYCESVRYNDNLTTSHPLPQAMSEELQFPINVIPGTPPHTHDALDFSYFEQEFYPQGWPTSTTNSYNDTYAKGHLTCQPLFSDDFSQGHASPISPGSSTYSLSPVARMFHDFSFDEQISGTADDPLLGGPICNEEQNALSGTSATISRRGQAAEGLLLTIPGSDPLDELFPPSRSAIDGFDGASLDASFSSVLGLPNPFVDPGHVDENYLNYNDLPPQSNLSPSSISPSYSSRSSSIISPSPISPSPRHHGHRSSSSMSLLSPTDSLSDSGSPVQHRRSYSHGSPYSINVNTNTSAALSPSLLSPPDMLDRNGNISQHRHGHSHRSGSVGGMARDTSALSPTSLLSPDHALQGHSLLQRRHSHSNGSDSRALGNQGPHLRRSRSTTTVRSRSPYERHPEPVPMTDIPASDPQASSSSSPQFVDHAWGSNLSSEPPSPSPSQEDNFRTYAGGSGIGYPILHRDTIASDAVLQASAKRRKKIANYKCGTCDQMLTSRDNLNNHQDAHDGIRRHKCDFCHDRFRTRSVLKRHQKSAKCPASRMLPKKVSQTFPAQSMFLTITLLLSTT